MEYYTAERKKELLPFATAWMELESIIAKWNKPGGEEQIPYDLTFNWNIIKKEKSKQNGTRDIEIKNNLNSNQRGGGRR